MPEQPLVSIIVPIYNAQDHIARCVESIRRQTYRNLEILLLNDGSQDVSLEVCKMYANVDPRIVLIDKANSGVAATRNMACGRPGASICSSSMPTTRSSPTPRSCWCSGPRRAAQIWSLRTTTALRRPAPVPRMTPAPSGPPGCRPTAS